MIRIRPFSQVAAYTPMRHLRSPSTKVLASPETEKNAFSYSHTIERRAKIIELQETQRTDPIEETSYFHRLFQKVADVKQQILPSSPNTEYNRGFAEGFQQGIWKGRSQTGVYGLALFGLYTLTKN